MQLSPSPPAFRRSAPSSRRTARRHRPARGPPNSASRKARAKGPAAARKWGQEGGGQVGARRRRWGDGGVRAGKQGARARPEAQARPARVPAAARPAQGAVWAPLEGQCSAGPRAGRAHLRPWPGRRTPGPPETRTPSRACTTHARRSHLRPWPGRRTPSRACTTHAGPRGPYLLAADAAVHRPAVSAVARSRSRHPQPSQKAPPRPRSLAAYAASSPAARGAAHYARPTATAAPAPGADGPLRRRGGAVLGGTKRGGEGRWRGRLRRGRSSGLSGARPEWGSVGARSPVA
ncbi:uncharacterized protein LOC144582487 [Callithrix jacchus]